MAGQHDMISGQLKRRDITDPAVLAAFARVPREAFIADNQRAKAYDDGPLPIGFGQTISQPYVVALTAQALRLGASDRVLEIGTGSGYAAAILSELVASVDTVERIDELAIAARDRLAKLGYDRVHVHSADGSLGWPAGAPYDAIAVACAAPIAPPSLLAQLAIGGRMVVPVGRDDDQQLVRITRDDATTFNTEQLGEVRFVPLRGAEGFP